MKLPQILPAKPTMSDQPVYAVSNDAYSLEPQFGCQIACTAACAGKAGFAACLARCLATGEACGGGLNNCSKVC